MKNRNVLGKGFALLTLGTCAWLFGAAGENTGVVELSFVDEVTAQPVPVRVELVDEKGKGWIATDALATGPHNHFLKFTLPLTDAQAKEALKKDMLQEVKRPFRDVVQGYSTGTARFVLPPGVYQLRVYKGFEYQIAKDTLHVKAGDKIGKTVSMERWINMPQRGWYGADDHIHIPRPHPDFNRPILRWMQAEDLHVACLLQWGTATDSNRTTQYAFGNESVYQEGTHMLTGGQENPRTNLLGHCILLGQKEPIHFAQNYLDYRPFFQTAEGQGGLAGYAHYGHQSQTTGLSLDLPTNLVRFIEVLQFERASYEVWYDALNAGFKVFPTAGTDFTGKWRWMPGQERFYTHLGRPLTYQNWLAALKDGKTFISNGPMAFLTVNGQEPSTQDLELEKPGPVKVAGTVLFDPSQDTIESVQVICNGKTVHRLDKPTRPGEFQFTWSYPAGEGCWLAMSAEGIKPPEQPGEKGRLRRSLAHTAPVYVKVKGEATRAELPLARETALKWLKHLEQLDDGLKDNNRKKYLESLPGSPKPSLELVDKNLVRLRALIQEARTHFSRLAARQVK